MANGGLIGPVKVIGTSTTTTTTPTTTTTGPGRVPQRVGRRRRLDRSGCGHQRERVRRAGGLAEHADRSVQSRRSPRC